MRGALARSAFAALLALAAASAHANDWGNFAIISNTLGNHAGRLCVGEGLRVSDIGCPTYAPSITTAGDVSITGNVSANKFIGDGSLLTGVGGGLGDRITSGTVSVTVNPTGYVSLSTAGTDWGYLNSAISYLPSIFTTSVSSTRVSATNISATLVDATRNGTVSATYLNGRYLSATEVSAARINATNISGTLIQVGNNGAVCNSTISGSLRFSQVSSTLEYCNSVAWIGVANSTDTSLTAFTVTKNAAQTGINSGDVVTWEAVTTNNGGAFNLSTERFVAPASGYYFFIFSGTTNADTSVGSFYIYKNGTSTVLRAYGGQGTEIYKAMTAQGVLYLAAGDYVDVRSAQASQTLYGAPGGPISTFSGFLLNAGGVSTGGASTLAALTDVDTSGASTGNILSYNGSQWVVSNTATSLSDRIISGTTNVIATQDRSVTISTAGVQRMMVGENGRVGIGTDTPEGRLHVFGTMFVGGTGSSVLKLGTASVGNQFSYIDLVGDDTYTDFGLRMIRGNAGPNAESEIATRGSGGLVLSVNEAGPIRFKTSASERMLIDALGNVGIGTNSPNKKLELANSIGPSTTLRLSASKDSNGNLQPLGEIESGYTSSAWADGYLGFNAPTATPYLTSPTRAMTILSNGNVGIGTSAPSTMLQVAGDVNLTGSDTRILRFGNLADNDYASLGLFNGGLALSGSFSGTSSNLQHMFISNAGNIGISTTNPIAKLDVVGTISASNAIQVGQSALACASGISGSIRFEPTSNTIQVCTGSTGWKSLASSTVVSGGTGLEDRIVSGTTNVIAYQDRSVTISTAGSQRMIIGENGSVGIGTMTPGLLPFQVSGSALFGGPNSGAGYSMMTQGNAGNTGYVGFYTSESARIGFVGFGSLGQRMSLATDGPTPILLTTSASEAVRITPAGNVGIGLTAPAAKLQVSGSFIVSTTQTGDDPALYVSGTTGRVGVGTDAPVATLDVSGSIAAAGSIIGKSRIYLGYDSDLTGNASTGQILMRYGDTVAEYGMVVGAGGVNNFRINDVKNGGANRLIIDNAGNIGISTSTPLAKLDVNGTISASNAIQVGQSALTCASGISGSIRYNTTSDTLQICTGSGWKSLASSTVAGGGTPAGSTGDVQFNNAGAFAADTGQLFWDATNDRLGVGTSTPSAPLDISDSTTSISSPFISINNGNALAQTAISFKVAGVERARIRSDYVGNLILSPVSGTGRSMHYGYDSMGTVGHYFYTSGSTLRTMAINTAGAEVSGSFIVSTTGQNTSPSLYVGVNGRVGIGTVNPSYQLHLQSAAPYIAFSDTDDANGAIGTITSYQGGMMYYDANVNNTPSSGAHFFRADGGTKALMMMLNNGNVGINKSNPIAKLDVVGTISASDAIQVGSSALTCGAGIPGAIRYSSGNLQFCNATTWTTLGSAGAATAASSTGAIQFNVANALAGDTANLFWDDTNNRLGIGTSAPTTTLHVYQTNASTPAIIADGANNYSGLSLRILGSEIARLWQEATGNLYIDADKDIYLRSSNTTAIYIKNNGNVGIDSITPIAKLDVNGTISASDAIQVGQSALTCAVGISGSIRFEPTSNTIQVCTGSTGWKSLASSTVAGGGATPAGSTGDIQFNNAGTFGADTGKLFWDATNNQMGIGTATPAGVLDLGSGTNGRALSWGGTSVNTANIWTAYSQGSLVLGSGLQGGTSSDIYESSYGASFARSAIRLNPSGVAGIQFFTNGASTVARGTEIVPTERMRIDTSGNVGIGTNSPNVLLHISDSTVGNNGPFLKISSGFTGGYSNGELLFDSYGASGIDFALGHGSGGNSFTIRDTTSAGGPYRFMIDSTGNVGINTTFPGAKLDVAGHVGLSGPTSNTISFGATGVAAPAAGSAGMKIQLYGSTRGTMAVTDYAIGIESSNMWFNTGGAYKWYAASGTQRMTLDSAGNLTAVAFLNSSDKRLKENVVSLTGGLAKLDAINPVSFSYISDTTHRKRLGVIAQDVEAVYPEAVVTDDKGMKTVDYPALIAPLISAVKELKADNDNLRLELQSQKLEIQKLKKAVGR